MDEINSGTAMLLDPFVDFVAYRVNCVSKKCKSHLGRELSCIHGLTDVHDRRLVGNQTAEL